MAALKSVSIKSDTCFLSLAVSFPAFILCLVHIFWCFCVSHNFLLKTGLFRYSSTAILNTDSPYPHLLLLLLICLVTWLGYSSDVCFPWNMKGLVLSHLVRTVVLARLSLTLSLIGRLFIYLFSSPPPPPPRSFIKLVASADITPRS